MLSYELKPIPAVSPSLAETLRNCPLQAALSRIAGIRDSVLGNPKAWLGSAYHEVLENLWAPNEETLTNNELIQSLWNEAIARLRQQIITHPLNRRFSEPEKWPGYYLTRSFAQIHAQEALDEHLRQMIHCAPGSVRREIREREFSSLGGKLVGKPDVVLDDEIRDYKSGSVYDDTPDGKQIIKQAYVRQLRLYGYLVHEQLGQCPSKGKLVPMQGEAVEISLDARTSAAEATEAVALLDAFNARLNGASSVSDIATPSPRACRWCQFKAVCPAFWSNADKAWSGELGSGCVRGVLEKHPTVIQNGRAFSITIRVTAGTANAPQITIAPLDSEIHTQVADWRSDDDVLIVNLYERHDHQLAPTRATLCLRRTECPVFKLPPTSPAST